MIGSICLNHVIIFIALLLPISTPSKGITNCCSVIVGIMYFPANNLDKGKEYEFRVRAQNRAGLGDPSPPSNSVVTKPKASKTHSPKTIL